MEELKTLLWLLIFYLPISFIFASMLEDIIEQKKKLKAFKKQCKKQKRELQELKEKQKYLINIYNNLK